MTETKREQLIDQMFSHEFGDKELAILIHPWMWASWMQIPEFTRRFERVIDPTKTISPFGVGKLIGRYEKILVYLESYDA